MLGLRNKLEELEEGRKPIKVCLIGAGMMGKGLVSQIMRVKGMEPSVVVSNKLDDCFKAYEYAGIKKEDIVVAKSVEAANSAMERGKFVIADDYNAVLGANLIDVVVDATDRKSTRLNSSHH